MRIIYLFVALASLSIAALLPGCVPASPPLPAEIPVGCVMAVSSAPAQGPNLIKAARLAVNEINEKGGIGGKKLSLILQDEGPTGATALYAVHKLIDEQKVQVIIGCTTSEAVMNAGPYMESKGVLLVSPSATSGSLSEQKWSGWTYRVCPSDALQGGVAAQLIKDKGYNKVAILVQDTVYGRGVEESAREYLKGMTDIIISLRYDPAKLSYLSELNSIKDQQPECILHAGLYSDGAVIYEQALKAGMDNIPWIAVDGSYGMPLDKYLDAAKFMEKAVTGTAPVPDSDSNIYKSFALGYEKAYGALPTVYCDTAYDGVYLIAAAMKKANSYSGNAIREALTVVGMGYPGVSGYITFDRSGERIAGLYGIWKVKMQGTQYEYVITGQSVNFLRPK
jgi:ABC-type branched-subunit amino acid transport system substrate-binding protein